MAEGALYAQNGEYNSACDKFSSVKSEFKELLALTDNEDFAVELDSRLACAQVKAGKYRESIALFEGLFRRQELEDKQRLQLFYGVALLRTGDPTQAQPLFFEAMTGSDPELAHSASDYLSTIGKSSYNV